jgi:hypothetical protein
VLPASALSRILSVQPILDAIERDQAAPRAAFDTLRIGQIVSGRVVRQGNGVGQVEIAGQTIEVELPHAAAVGESIRLQFTGRNPLPQFIAETTDAAATDNALFSPTARMLSEVVQNLPQRTLPTLAPTTPLLTAAAEPGQVASALQNAVVRSGLFYESHLADWVVGRDSLDGLMQEPQNRLLAIIATESTQPQAGNPLHALLTQQLQVLETPAFVWKGELWPGQHLEWQVLREQTDERAAHLATDDTPPGWQSQLKLTLPRLGALTVTLRLDRNSTLKLDVTTTSSTASLLQQHQSQLAERLTAAGCTLASIKVQQPETPDGDA